MSRQFMEALFGKLPEFFKDESKLRALWSVPDTRKKLLQGLAEKGFGPEQLGEMQRIINAEKRNFRYHDFKPDATGCHHMAPDRKPR